MLSTEPGGLYGPHTGTSMALAGKVLSGGRLNLAQTLNFDSVAPRATLSSAPNILVRGGTTQDVTVSFTDNVAVNVSSLGASDLTITRSSIDSTLVNGRLEDAEDRAILRAAIHESNAAADANIRFGTPRFEPSSLLQYSHLAARNSPRRPVVQPSWLSRT